MKYLITDSYLTSNTGVHKDTDAKLIRVALKQVTIADVKPLLSQPLYEVYETHVTSGTTLTAKQVELFDQIQYWMALRTERAMLSNLLTINNKGVTQEEHVANMDIVNFKRQEIEANASVVKKNILGYLQSNKADFPEFFPESSKPEPTSTPAYSSGIVFDYGPKQYFM
ncbi:hypothetical protein [Solirubrum puertoriconensis]|uniref:Uncharacterized protein n=1 Tax=Solirubrum puertoriconensis TaxID=1751427 RepID=A0A9X0HKE1_SOLP1|nr:hypothetical protein [Solirubrum puertoriconensis]KUG07416.1 hypothetical protein ASU33_13770 [Solirubrum puertoriconensis]